MRLSGMLAALILAASVGCNSGPEIGDVSGVVTLDGRPVSGAKVRFIPVHQPEHPEASKMMAIGVTDSEGGYSLVIYNGPDGAVVGENRVWISTAVEDENSSKLVVPEKIPYEYNVSSKLMFDVPAEGTDNADFALTSSHGRGR